MCRSPAISRPTWCITAAPAPRANTSIPYHKNDDPFVEQRNGHPVRTCLGYDRLDTVAQTQAVNQLYDQMWLSPSHQLVSCTFATPGTGTFCQRSSQGYTGLLPNIAV